MFTLKLFDTPLLDFEMKRENSTLQVKIFRLYDDVVSLLPLDWHISDGINSKKNSAHSLDCLEEPLKRWFSQRAIPSNRAYVKSFLAKLGLSERDIPGIIAICRGLSLNDCYWVVRENDASTFDKRNLYDNRFSNTLGHIAFTGVGSKVPSVFASTPELTTNGALAKCWRRINGKVYLFKEGSVGFANSGNEPYAEHYASQVATAMGVNCVPYVPTLWKGHFCSKCELFTSKRYGFISAGRLISSSGIDAVEQYCKDLGDEFEEAFSDMLVLDAIILNTDRHFGNFGFLVDNKLNEIVSPAPLFDHGMSLLYSALESDFENEEEFQTYVQALLPRTYDDFIGRAKQSMGRKQKEKVRGLLEFSFKKHPRYNWPSWRLKKLENLIHERAKLLLD